LTFWIRSENPLTVLDVRIRPKTVLPCIDYSASHRKVFCFR